MSSSEFQKVLVKDERLDCHPAIPFAVYKSGQNVTVAKFDAISTSPASHTYNIQVPSETTVIDRRVMWESTVQFRVSFTVQAGSQAVLTNGSAVLQFGNTVGFGPWPLHTLCTTQQITINNNTVSINMNDVIPAIGKLGIDRELQHYNQTALTETDFYQSQSTAQLYAGSPLSAVNNMNQDRCYKPRGTLANVALTEPTLAGAALDGFLWNSATAGAATPNNTGGIWSCKVTATFIEPLICSPFLYTNPYYNGQGFYGIQNLNFVFNINGSGSSGFFRLGYNAAQSARITAPSTEILQFTNSSLVFNFLSPKPSDMLTARNVVPYWEMPRFTTGNFNGPVARTIPNLNPAGLNNGVVVPGACSVSSQTLQLNQIPDKLIIFVRPRKSTRTPYDTDFCMGIKGISINFNNQSGILASATQNQLWRYSVESGSIQTWEEFVGIANTTPPDGQSIGPIPMLGSYLMLEFGRHIQITEDYYASGSLGNFNLQFTLQVENYTATDYSLANTLELVLITQNSGIFVTEKGQSATYTGVLTKDDVLSASASGSVNERALQRMVGGGPKLDRVLGFVDSALPVASKIGQSILPDTGALGKLKKGLTMAEDVRGAIRGNGRAGGRVQGAGKGSAKFSLDDRLV